MKRAELLALLQSHRLLVQASCNEQRGPQAAVVGYGVSDELEIVFDTLDATRKYKNLVRNPRVALVIEWDQQRTLQLEGLVDFPHGQELERIRDVYFVAYPDGRDRLSWPGIAHARVVLGWGRYSDFSVEPPRIEEFDVSGLE
jgi:pyridoxine/pyridoxamine 5'-phosphate oxidase